MKKKLIVILIIFFSTAVYFYIKNNLKNKIDNNNTNNKEEILYNSNIIENVKYTSKDSRGNVYEIFAAQGEIDYNNTNFVFLTNVSGLIKLEDSKIIRIQSDFGKYNIDNFDTIFSKNVIIKHQENTIRGEYLDFSIQKNLMTISRNVTYNNLKNILKADVIDIDLKTKDTKIYRYDSKKKINIKSKK